MVKGPEQQARPRGILDRQLSRKEFLGLGFTATALTGVGLRIGWRATEVAPAPLAEPFDPSTLTARNIYEAQSNNRTVEAPAFPETPGMNLLTNLTEQRKYLRQTGATEIGWTMHYTDGQEAQTAGVTLDKDPEGSVITDELGEEYLHLKLHPTDRPVFLQYRQVINGVESKSDPIPWHIQTVPYTTIEDHEPKRVYHDGSLDEGRLLEIHEFIKDFDFLFPEGMHPKICIRQGIKKINSLLPEQPLLLKAAVDPHAITFDQDAFAEMKNENWKEIVTYDIGRYLFQQLSVSPDTSTQIAMTEFRRRIDDPVLASSLASSNRPINEYAENPDPLLLLTLSAPYTSIYDFLFTPPSYIPELTGRSDFSLRTESSAENSFAGFAYKVLQDAKPQKSYHKTPSRMTLHYYNLQDNNEWIENHTRHIAYYDPRRSDKATASLIAKPMLDMLRLRCQTAPESIQKILNAVQGIFQLGDTQPFATYPATPLAETIATSSGKESTRHPK